LTDFKSDFIFYIQNYTVYLLCT